MVLNMKWKGLIYLKIEKIKRGCLNSKVQKIAKGFLGREITTRELRLYPYIDYCIKNGGFYKPEQINEDEVEILKKIVTRRSCNKYAKYNHLYERIL